MSLGLASALSAAVAAASVPSPGPPATAEPARALHALFDEAWEFELREDPLRATSVGDRRYDDRLPSMTAPDLERRAAHWRDVEKRLAAVDRTRLDQRDRASLALLARRARDEAAAFEFKAHLVPITNEGGFHTRFARLPADTPFAGVRDYDNYLARLRGFPAYAEQHVALLRRGLASGFTLPRVVLNGYEATITPHLVDDVSRSVFWRPFEGFPTAVSEAERERLRAAGRAAIAEVVIPTYRSLLDFFTREYIPGCRATTGASDLPDGGAYYAHRVRHFTTLDVTPEAVHRIGLAEVERIRGEMLAVLDQVGFDRGLPAFIQFLRTDPRFYAKTPEELLKQAAWIAKRMDGKLPSLFKTLPRQPYGVAPVPADLAPKYTGGRYHGAPIDGPRAAEYWVNTYALDSRPLYVLEALTLHEAVPGHHLQNALQRELNDLPAFRRHGYVEAFGEGWGLYSERLGLEAGFYTDPYSNFGRLTYEMWRACRLVVDTGLHAKGWTRQQALDFLAANTALSLHEIETETDRYISWPGQALAYKMGELKIRELRRTAEETLGARFDVREFHDAVLASGTVPLTVLEEQVRAYVAAVRARSSR